MPNDGEPVQKSGVRPDFWFGFGLVVFGFAVAAESWRMPRLSELNVHPMTAPGLVPGLIGAVIFVLGGILFIRSAWAGGWRAPAANGDSTEFANETKRFFATLALCVGYAAGLVGQVPFWAATFLFVFGFISLFEWRSDSSRAARARALGLAALQAAIVAAVVTYVFEQIFLVRLP
jgi:hypothetical protein